MSNRKTIAKNASVLMGSQLITWALTLLLTVFLPRYLGADAIGKFHFANSVWAIVAIIVAFGMDNFLTKEIAREPESLNSLIWDSAVLRLLLFVLGFGTMIAFLYAFDYPAETRNVVYVIGIANLLWQFISVTQAALQGVERMEFNSIGNIIGKAVNTVISIALLLMGYGVVVIAAVNVVAAAVNLGVQIFFLGRLTPLKIHVRPAYWSGMLRSGLPYLASGVFLVIYMQFDIVIISLLINDTAVGWYGAADQLFGTLLFVPTVMMTAVFPALSRMYVSEPDAMQKVTRRSFDLLMVMSVPIGLGVLAIANPLVVLLFGAEFAQSGPILALMGIVLILTYLNILIGRFLISMDRQKQWAWVMAIATVATVPIDLVFIPWCDANLGNGGIGGSISFIITEGGMLAAGLMLLPKGMLARENLWLSLRALLAGLLMTAAIYPLRDYFLAIPILVAVLVYGVLVFVLKLVPAEDFQLVREMAGNILSRVKRRSSSGN